MFNKSRMLWILVSKWEAKPQLRFLSYTVLNDNESCFKKINTHLRMQQMKKKVTLNVRCKLVIILYLFPDVHGPESLKLRGRI